MLKQSWKDEEEAANTDSNDEDEQESEASSKASVSMKDDLITFMITLFGHDPVFTSDLADD